MQKVQATKQTQGLKGSALIFGAMSLPTEAEIMASFPSKYTADMLLRRFFATLDPSISKFSCLIMYKIKKTNNLYSACPRPDVLERGMHVPV